MTDYNPRRRPRAYGGDVLAFARYGVVGVAQNVLFYSIGLGLIWLKFKAWQVQVFLYPLGVTVSFLLNRAWSFGNRTKSPRQFRNYGLIYVIAYPLSIAFTWQEEHLGVPAWLAILVTMVIAACGIFSALNYWVFRTGATDEISA